MLDCIVRITAKSLVLCLIRARVYKDHFLNRRLQSYQAAAESR